MTFYIVTLFPGAFDSYLGQSILKRAIEDKKIRVKFYNPRDFAENKWRRIDRSPYGGGPGLVIEALPVLKTVEKIYSQVLKSVRTQKKRGPRIRIILLSPSGKTFNTAYAKKTAKQFDHVILICGRYEGIDARVQKILKAEAISVGPYVLTGGELPAMTILDSISRQIPGVLGNVDSLEESRISSSEFYTRPEKLQWKGKTYIVPRILLSGHHRKIEEWKSRLTQGRWHV